MACAAVSLPTTLPAQTRERRTRASRTQDRASLPWSGRPISPLVCRIATSLKRAIGAHFAPPGTRKLCNAHQMRGKIATKSWSAIVTAAHFRCPEFALGVMCICGLRGRERLAFSRRMIISLGESHERSKEKAFARCGQRPECRRLVSLAAPFAYAQQHHAARTGQHRNAQTQKIEKIEVTGSRIPSPTLTSESPVNVISAQDIKYTGLTSTSDIINQLPQAFADQGNNLANGSTGRRR